MLRILYLIPKNCLSRLIGWLVRLEQPAFLAKLSLNIFVNFYKPNLTEAEHPLDHYSCIGKFFTRNLKTGCRPVAGRIVSPVDGILRVIEPLIAGKLLQVKNLTYTVSDLLQDATASKKFTEGWAGNFYLTPKDYHHIHSPIKGNVIGYRHIPGNLWPVNDWSLENIEQLFCVNERVVVYIKTETGLCAVVMVGATNVGQISLDFDALVTNQFSLNQKSKEVMYSNPINVDAGQRLGTFHMGSSVVVLFETKELKPLAESGNRVKYGESLFALQ